MWRKTFGPEDEAMLPIVREWGMDGYGAFVACLCRVQELGYLPTLDAYTISRWTGSSTKRTKKYVEVFQSVLKQLSNAIGYRLNDDSNAIETGLNRDSITIQSRSNQDSIAFGEASNPRGSTRDQEKNRLEENREDPPLTPQEDEGGEGWDLSPEFMAALNLPREEVRETVKEPAIPDRDALDGQNPSPPLPPPPPSQPVDEVRAYVDRFVGRIGKRRMVVSSDYGNWDHILRKLANDGTPLDVLDKVHERALAESFWGVNGLHCLTDAAKFEAKLGKLIERFATEPPHPVLHKLQQHPFWIDTQTGAVFFPTDFVVADKDSIHSPVMPHVLITLDCLSWHLRPCPLAEMTQEVVDENLASPHCRHSLQEILDHGNRQAS